MILGIAAAACAGQSFLKKTTFEDQPAVALANDKLSLTTILSGGAFAAIVLADDPAKMNPLWDPMRMAREAGRKMRFNGGTGHFLCVDGFGEVSPEERAAGLPGHGEAHLQPWEIRMSSKEGKLATLVFETRLPLVEESLRRTIRLQDGENVIYVQTELESRLGFDRPICWAEHATIGSPFLEPGLTVVDMPAKRARTRPYDRPRSTPPHRLAPDKEFTWPMAPSVKGKKIDVRAAPENPNSGDHTTCLLDPARKLVWVTALHTGKGLILGYIFKREEYPWVQSWEDYAPNRMARGMEFGTMPFDVPRRQAISMGTMFDTPTFRWLPAKAKIESRFLFFYAHAPEGFRKVDDVRLENGQIVVEDHRAKKQIVLAASLPL